MKTVIKKTVSKIWKRFLIIPLIDSGPQQADAIRATAAFL